MLTVADEIGPKRDETSRAKAASKSWVVVIYTSINDGNSYTCTGHAFGSELIDLHSKGRRISTCVKEPHMSFRA